MPDREMNAAELHWWKQFKRVVKDLPPTLELSVYHASISVCERGARQAAFDRDGHADQTEDFTFVQTKHIYPNGEAL